MLLGGVGRIVPCYFRENASSCFRPIWGFNARPMVHVQFNNTSSSQRVTLMD